MQSNRMDKWKILSSYIYDYVFENNLEWPCATCKWGPIVDRTEDYFKQKVYFTCRTDGSYSETENLWKRFASFIVVAVADIPNVDAGFDQELNSIFLQQNFKKCPLLSVKQVIIHPGDINVIKRSNIDAKWIATHSDSPYVYVWNLDKHNHIPNAKENIPAENPELILTGHQGIAPYALEWANNNSRIASGGSDNKVLIWDIEDYQTSMSTHLLMNKRELNAINHSNDFSNLKIQAKYELKGHTDCVEDLSFHSKNKEMLCSVSSDKSMIVWDIRTPEKIAYKMEEIHKEDTHTVDWCVPNEYLIASGSSDGTAVIIDTRKRQELFRFACGNKKVPIRSTKFAPFSDKYIGMGSDHLYVYDITDEKTAQKPLFSHPGHKGLVSDFDWNPWDKWSILSASENIDANNIGNTGGGSLHLYRPIDLIYQPESVSLSKLSKMFSQ